MIRWLKHLRSEERRFWAGLRPDQSVTVATLMLGCLLIGGGVGLALGAFVAGAAWLFWLGLLTGVAGFALGGMAGAFAPIVSSHPDVVYAARRNVEPRRRHKPYR